MRSVHRGRSSSVRSSAETTFGLSPETDHDKPTVCSFGNAAHSSAKPSANDGVQATKSDLRQCSARLARPR